MYEYDSDFYRFLAESSVKSAEAAVPRVRAVLPFKSMLDVGCGAGAWLAAYAKNGVADYVGVDGAYVRPEQLLIDRSRFTPRNVAEAFDLGRQFDFVQCLEVGEHVPREGSATLVDNIVRHGRTVLFSAAVPGQGGENHINERPLEFWRKLFRERGYLPFDAFRPTVRGDERVEFWYRYNPVFYVHESAVAQLPEAVRRTAVADSASIPSVAPFSFRVRCAVLRPFPPSMVTRMAIVKHKMRIRRHASGA